MAVEMKKHRTYLSATCILNYSNTQYNNLFNSNIVINNRVVHNDIFKAEKRLD